MNFERQNCRYRNGLTLVPLIIVVATIFLWEVLCSVFTVPEYLIPKPSRVAQAFFERSLTLSVDALVTLVEALVGFILANVCALLVAIFYYFNRTIERATFPLIVGMKSVPLVAIAPLLVLWLGYGFLSKVVMAAIVAYFPLIVGVMTGIRSIAPEAVELLRSLSATRSELLFKLCLPASVPHLVSALKVSSTLAVVGAIVAELTGARRGLGFTILMASYNVDTPMLFAAIMLAAAVGLFLYGLAIFVEYCLRNYLGGRVID